MSDAPYFWLGADAEPQSRVYPWTEIKYVDGKTIVTKEYPENESAEKEQPE